MLYAAGSFFLPIFTSVYNLHNMTSQNLPATSRDIWRIMRLSAIVITIGATVFIVAALIIHQVYGSFVPEWKEHKTWIIAGLLIFSLAALILGKILMQKRIEQALVQGTALPDQLRHYTAGLQIYLAACELPVAAGCILYLASGEFGCLVFAAVMVGNMLAQWPLKRRVKAALQLSDIDINELENV